MAGMNRVWIIGALLGAIALASEIVGLAPATNGSPAGPNGADFPTRIADLGAARAEPAADRSGEWAARILARPLFSPTRRSTEIRGARAAGPADPPRLSGILCRPGACYAIFQPEKAPHALVLGEGTALESWTIRTIAGDSVTVSRGDERLVLRPSFVGANGIISVPIRTAERARDPWGRHLPPLSYLERRRE